MKLFAVSVLSLMIVATGCTAEVDEDEIDESILETPLLTPAGECSPYPTYSYFLGDCGGYCPPYQRELYRIEKNCSKTTVSLDRCVVSDQCY